MGSTSGTTFPRSRRGGDCASTAVESNGRRGARSGRHAVKVVVVRIFDANADNVARLEAACVAQVNLAVDLGRVGLRAAGRAAGLAVDRIDQHVDPAADLRGELLGADAGGQG